MKSIEERIAQQQEIVLENNELLKDEENLNDEEVDGYNSNIDEALLVITTLEWAVKQMESNLVEGLENASQNVTDKVKNHNYEEGKTIMFIGDEDIIDTDQVENVVSEIIEDEGDDTFNDLHFCDIGCRYEDIECKIAGITKVGDKVQLHLFGCEDQKHRLINFDYLDVRIDLLADLADML